MKVEVGKRYTFQITAGHGVRSLTHHQVVRINDPIVWVQEDDAGPLFALEMPITSNAVIDDE